MKKKDIATFIEEMESIGDEWTTDQSKMSMVTFLWMRRWPIGKHRLGLSSTLSAK